MSEAQVQEEAPQKGFAELLVENSIKAKSSGNSRIESFVVMKDFVTSMHRLANVEITEEGYFASGNYTNGSGLFDFNLEEFFTNNPDRIDEALDIMSKHRDRAVQVESVYARRATVSLNLNRVVQTMNSLPVYVAPTPEGAEEEDDFI